MKFERTVLAQEYIFFFAKINLATYPSIVTLVFIYLIKIEIRNSVSDFQNFNAKDFVAMRSGYSFLVSSSSFVE